MGACCMNLDCCLLVLHSTAGSLGQWQQVTGNRCVMSVHSLLYLHPLPACVEHDMLHLLAVPAVPLRTGHQSSLSSHRPGAQRGGNDVEGVEGRVVGIRHLLLTSSLLHALRPSSSSQSCAHMLLTAIEPGQL
jgi:hypothetical protein